MPAPPAFQPQSGQDQLGLADSIIACLSSGMIILDPENRVMKANPYTAALLDMELDRIEGQPIEQIFPGINISLEQVRGEYQLAKPNGDSLTIGYNLSAIIGGDAEVQGIVIIFRDLTEIIQLRRKVQHKERFAIIGEMTSWVAHEVKNPLFGIRAIAEILAEEEAGRVKVFAESILQETARLSHLVEDLLNYGKPIELNLRPMNPGTLIREALRMVGCSAEQLQVDIKIDDREMQGLFDRNRMVQVLLNIIRNSVESGADSIQVEVSRMPDRAMSIRLCDNGSGIPEKDRQKILKPFFTTKSSGTGLGLAISKKIIDQHGGQIEIVSPETGGTCVSLFFPNVVR